MGSTTIIPWIRHGVGDATYGGSKTRLAQFLKGLPETGNSNIFTFEKGKKTSLKNAIEKEICY